MKVLLADHQPLTCAGLQQVLGTRSEITVVEEVATGKRLPALLQTHQPDLLIADYCFNNLFTRDDLDTAAEFSSQTNVLVISADQDKGSILRVVQSGIPGYLTKKCTADEMIRAVYAVGRGDKYFCAKVLDIILEKQLIQEPATSTAGQLTARETEILTLLASGYATQKIADQLYLSPHTVHTHRKSIIRKLSIKSPTEFVIHAMDLGLIEPKFKKR
jgi:DNA-binding NarL/FixJ family response regulator